jgi:hypothetical protein
MDAKKPKVKFVGANGNAFNLLGLCYAAAKKAGWSAEEWTEVKKQMMSGDYDHLLQTAMKHFEVN